jgi:hypothetical protein
MGIFFKKDHDINYSLHLQLFEMSHVDMIVFTSSIKNVTTVSFISSYITNHIPT